MKIKTSLLAVLLMTLVMAACAPMTSASQPDQPSVPTLAPSNTPGPTETVTNIPLVVVSTSVQASAGGAIDTPTPTPGVGSNPSSQAVPQGGITLADDGKTFTMHTGDTFLLNLGMDVYDWNLAIDHQDVLSRVKNIAVIRGAQGVYQALQPGQAVLTAGGNPFCRSAKPACMMPSLMFKVTIIVQ